MCLVPSAREQLDLDPDGQLICDRDRAERMGDEPVDRVVG
jgi:hypothetical protein